MQCQDEGWDAAHVEPAGDGRLLIDIELDEPALGSIAAAAFSNSGAIILQGPHHAAQKSISNGTSLFSRCRSKRAVSSTTGCALNKAWWHCPQRPPSGSLSLGKRLIVSQCGQTMWTAAISCSWRLTRRRSSDLGIRGAEYNRQTSAGPARLRFAGDPAVRSCNLRPRIGKSPPPREEGQPCN